MVEWSKVGCGQVQLLQLRHVIEGVMKLLASIIRQNGCICTVLATLLEGPSTHTNIHSGH